jgi:hypothetical protein
MQQVQDRLNFKIETPSNEELAKRFAARQQEISGSYNPTPTQPYKKRPTKSAKKHARSNKKYKRAKAKSCLI